MNVPAAFDGRRTSVRTAVLVLVAMLLLLMMLLLMLIGASSASAWSKNCKTYVVSGSDVTLSATNRGSSVRPSCIDAVGIAYNAIQKDYPRRLSIWWRGRVLTMNRTFMFARRDYFSVIYANSRQKVAFTSYEGRIVGGACGVLEVQC